MEGGDNMYVYIVLFILLLCTGEGGVEDMCIKLLLCPGRWRGGGICIRIAKLFM